MEQNVLKLEELLNKKYEDWTQETLAEVINSEEAINLFTPELVVHLLLERKNDNLLSTLLPVKFGFDVRAIKEKIEGYLTELKENNGSIEDYQKNILALKEYDNPIYKIAVYLTEVASFREDYDVSKEEEDIRKAIADLKILLDSLSIDEGFQVILEILDIVFPLRELYFQRYNVDLLKDDNDFDILLAALNKKSQEMLDLFNQMKADGLIPDEEHDHDHDDHNHDE
jgi:pentatricopeptide repeat protein